MFTPAKIHAGFETFLRGSTSIVGVVSPLTNQPESLSQLTLKQGRLAVILIVCTSINLSTGQVKSFSWRPYCVRWLRLVGEAELALSGAGIWDTRRPHRPAQCGAQ